MPVISSVELVDEDQEDTPLAKQVKEDMAILNAIENKNAKQIPGEPSIQPGGKKSRRSRRSKKSRRSRK